MIYYNNKIIQVDFKVFESKSYKFFIDEELCEIKVIENRNGSFGYEFEFDHKADTKWNRIRKKIERKWAVQSVTFIVGFFVVLIAISSIFLYFREAFLIRQLERTGEYATVTMRLLDRMGKGRYETFYYFKTERGDKYSSKINIVTQLPTTYHGLPIENGDNFKIKVAKNNKFNHKIDFDQPTSDTANKMIGRIVEFHIQHHQGRMQDELYCEVKAAYETLGMNGLAHIYHQLAAPEKKSDFNKNTYQNLLRDKNFSNATEICIIAREKALEEAENNTVSIDSLQIDEPIEEID